MGKASSHTTHPPTHPLSLPLPCFFLIYTHPTHPPTLLPSSFSSSFFPFQGKKGL